MAGQGVTYETVSCIGDSYTAELFIHAKLMINVLTSHSKQHITEHILLL